MGLNFQRYNSSFAPAGQHRIKTNKRMFRYNGKLINDMIDIIKQ